MIKIHPYEADVVNKVSHIEVEVARAFICTGILWILNVRAVPGDGLLCLCDCELAADAKT